MGVWLLIACVRGEGDSGVQDRALATVTGAGFPVGAAVFGLGDLNGDGADELGVAWTEHVIDEIADQQLTGGVSLEIFPGGQSGAFTPIDAWRTLTTIGVGRWMVDPGLCDAPRVPGHVNVIGLGDWDGDGLGELAIADASVDTGAVFVITGAQLAQSDRSLDLTQAQWVLQGPASTWDFGTDLDVGDLNSDGVLDLVVGAPFTGQTDKAGAVLVFSGAHVGARPAGVVGWQDAGWLLEATRARGGLGERVQVVDDVDGDGVPDVVALGPGCDLPDGIGYIGVFGSRRYPSLGGTGRQPPDVAYLAEGHLRVGLVSLGDVDRDGLGDLAVAGLIQDDEPSIGVLLGGALAEPGPNEPSNRFQTGGDSRNAVTAVGGRVYAYDGDSVIQVADPHLQSGWLKSGSWPTPCASSTAIPAHRRLAALDWDGDGVMELAVGEPDVPCGAETKTGWVGVLALQE
jgi:hypothetical protein